MTAPTGNITGNVINLLNKLDLCNGVGIEEATIDQLHEYMSVGKLMSEQLTICYMDRVFQVERYMNSVLQLNPNALDIAKSSDAERAAGHVRAAGSLALVGSIVPRDAFVVAQLRRGGAVLMGKATLSEWADMRSTTYSEGYSATGGQARNFYNLTVNPGGSSSGSAIAVANNVAPFALGTETDGSVINPAERNAIVGIKPTVGLTSRAGVVPESIHQDTVGTFGRTVRDAVYALDVIYVVDFRDNYTSAQIGKTPTGYSTFLSNSTALRGAKFGIPWQSFWALADPEQQSILLSLLSSSTALAPPSSTTPKSPTTKRSLAIMAGTGITEPRASEYTYVNVDFYNNLQTYLSELGNTTIIKSVADVVRFNNEHAYVEGAFPGLNPAFVLGQDGFFASLATGGAMNETYWEALNFCQSSTRWGIDDGLIRRGEGGKLDALLVPPDVRQSYQIAAQAGYHMITIPAGAHSKSGMPFGLALMGTAWGEAELVRWASAIEDLHLWEGRRRRTRPEWKGLGVDNVPVDNQCFGC
ncbi:MAG: hypothetical protein Q9166_007147 [cf. Caloplaca sp. 2 TL-2023]